MLQNLNDSHETEGAKVKVKVKVKVIYLLHVPTVLVGLSSHFLHRLKSVQYAVCPVYQTRLL